MSKTVWYNGKRGYPESMRQRSLELYKDGMGSATISFMYGIDDSTVLLWVQKAGIKVDRAENITVIDGEKWYPVPNYEGLYELSNLGRIKSLPRKTNYNTTRIVTHKYIDSGYPFVQLSKNGIKEQFLIHRLIAQMFIPNPLNLPEVNHKNLDKKDHSVDNLEWITTEDNMKHAHKNGAFKYRRLGDNPKSRRIGSFTEDGVLVKEYSCAIEAKQDGFIPQNIYQRLLSGKPHKGYFWKYL